MPTTLKAICALLLGSLSLACAEDSDRRDILGSEINRYSQLGEELIIRDFFQDRTDGFFVDVGCAWPKQDSNTYYLEAHLGWRGIAIDALQDYAPAWKTERPRSRFFSYLVSDHSDTREPFYRAKATGLSSTRKDRVFFGKKVKQTRIEVETITLDKLLDDQGVSKIDFLTMDIEEHEPQALAGFDIERFRPELVCVESSPSIRLQLLEYFNAHGYERIERYVERDFANWYFAPKAK